MRRIVFLILITLLSWPLAASGASFEEMVSGPPVLKSSAFDDNTYIEVKTRRLKNARLMWLNERYLRERGILELPSEALVLEHLGFAVPHEGDPKEAFLSAEKIYYADYYGGLGVGDNLGSGRAAATGRVQVKGVGRTQLVREADIWHSHGGASRREAIHEAIWGEMLHRELPYGAVRVVALISTGTFNQDGVGEPRALIVREDVVRPAHFLVPPTLKGEELKAAKQRVRRLIEKLPELLPLPPNLVRSQLAPAEAVRAGVREFVFRVAHQYAASYAKSFLHGATSPSNIALDGRALDFGSQTAIDGFARVQTLANDAPFGDIKVVETDLLREFLTGLHENAPKKFKDVLPSTEQAVIQFRKDYARMREHEMLLLTGLPEEILLRLPAKTRARLARVLLEVAQAGNTKVFLVEGNAAVPENTGKYDLADILKKAAEAKSWTAKSIGEALKGAIEAKSARDLYRSPAMWERLTEQSKIFEQSANVNQLKNFIDQLMSKSVKTFDSRRDYCETVLKVADVFSEQTEKKDTQPGKQKAEPSP